MRKVNILLLLPVPFFPLLLLCLGLHFCFHQKGFHRNKAVLCCKTPPSWSSPIYSREQNDFFLDKVVSQVYYYLTSGSLCYAFVSEDRRYVIKFFKVQNLTTENASFWSSFTMKNDKNRFMDACFFVERIFSNYIDAFQHLKEETGLIYVHLNKTEDLKKKVLVVDSKGKQHFIDLDQTEFLVQRKAELIYEQLTKLCKFKKTKKAQKIIRSFFELVASRCAKGFSSSDLSLKHHFGVCEGKVIQINCSKLTKDDSAQYPYNFKREVLQIADSFNQWAQTDNPDLCVMIQEEAQRVINAY